MRRQTQLAQVNPANLGHTSGTSWNKGIGSCAYSPSLPLRPITTHINLLVVGASRSGKGAFVQSLADALGLTPTTPKASVPSTSTHTASSAAGSGCGGAKHQLRGASDPWGAFTCSPGAWRTTYTPLLVPAAGRELVYSIQSAPGWGSTVDHAAWLEAVVGLVLGARQQDHEEYGQLAGCTALHRSVMCGALPNSYTAALYFLPPTGPTATDLVLLGALSKLLPLVPVIGHTWSAPDPEAVTTLLAEVEQLLAAPGELVPGLKPGDIQLPTRPAVKSLWASPEATAADVAAPEVPYGGVTPTPSTAASPRRHLDHGNLDVISLSSEDDATYSTEGASAFASAGASKVSVPGSTQAAASAAGGGNGGDGKQPLLELLELLAGPEVYCLLDASWDAFTFFCTAYGAAGRQLGPLVAAAVQQFAKGLLAGPDTAFGKQVQLVHTQQELEHKVMELQQQLAAVQAELEQERSCHAQTRQQLQGANDQVARYPEALQGPRSKSRATGKPVWLTASAEDTPSARWARHLQVDLGKGKRRSQLLRELREDKEVFTSMHCM